MIWISCIFFFQAEDGIRDGTVTGVQTCALPICDDVHGDPGPCRGDAKIANVERPAAVVRERIVTRAAAAGGEQQRGATPAQRRSEERRVGKECRARGAREDERKRSRGGTRGVVG